MLKLIILILVFSFSNTQKVDTKSQQQSKGIFPHTIWTYYNNDINQAPLLTQLSYNNIKHYANVSNWKLNLVNQKNIHLYLNDKNAKTLNMIKEKKKKNLDLHGEGAIESFLLSFQNGGMWIDLSCIFLRDLSWIDQIVKQNMFYNTISSQPQVIFYTNNQKYSSNKTKVKDQKLEKEVILFPGLQIWAFIAKAKARLLGDVIDMLSLAYIKQTKNDTYKQNQNQGYQYLAQRKQDHFDGTYQLITALQKKQKEIDQDPKNYQQKYAIEYYKIWCIDSRQTAELIEENNFRYTQKIVKSLMYESLEELAHQNKVSQSIMKLNHNKLVMDKILQLTSNESLDCYYGLKHIVNNSIINQYLFKYSQHLEVIQKINAAQADRRNWQCTLHNSKLNEVSKIFSFYRQNEFLFKMLMCIFTVLGIIYTCRDIHKLIEKWTIFFIKEK